MPFTASDICKIILAIFLPPLGVFLERGCNADFFINILLTILGYIPVRLPHSTPLHTTRVRLLTQRPGYRPRAVHHLQILAAAAVTLSLAENAPCPRPDLTFSIWGKGVGWRRGGHDITIPNFCFF